MRHLLAVTLVALLFNLNPAQAGLYIEPYASYGFGSVDGKFSGTFPVIGAVTDAKVDEDLAGSNYGAKLGYSFLLLVVGADYMGGTMTGKGKSALSEESYTTDYKNTNIGAFVQLSLPLVKVSATYFVSSKAVDDDDTETKGSGMKVGIGISIFPFVSLNIDQVMINHDESSYAAITAFDVDISYTMVGLSVPLSL